jgi:4-amino-4-deoxy-L-arabinose transferase-like glycosyltransferase
LRVPTETALRLPNAVLGALTVLLIYLLAAELFGIEVGLIAAALWAFDPSALGFNRIVKEDTALLFFFLLANVCWLRGQRVAESGSGRPQPYYWATGAAFGAMVASKYVPFLILISICYYDIFQRDPATRWRLGKRRILIFFARGCWLFALEIVPLGFLVSFQRWPIVTYPTIIQVACQVVDLNRGINLGRSACQKYKAI